MHVEYSLTSTIAIFVLCVYIQTRTKQSMSKSKSQKQSNQEVSCPSLMSFPRVISKEYMKGRGIVEHQIYSR